MRIVETQKQQAHRCAWVHFGALKRGPLSMGHSQRHNARCRVESVFCRFHRACMSPAACVNTCSMRLAPCLHAARHAGTLWSKAKCSCQRSRSPRPALSCRAWPTSAPGLVGYPPDETCWTCCAVLAALVLSCAVLPHRPAQPLRRHSSMSRSTLLVLVVLVVLRTACAFECESEEA